MVWLRILHINDVYELDNFPHFATVVQEESLLSSQEKRPDRTLVVLAGDFLSPSLLSSLDKGASMIDMLNHVGVTHVCLGNHECDVPMETLKKRIMTSQFTWINSNMPELVDHLEKCPKHPKDVVPIATKMPKYSIIQVQDKRIGLLGLLTNDPGIYRPGAWSGATIQPIISTARDILDDNDVDNNKVDLWIPLTHQSMAEDRDFGKHFGGSIFPLVIGGHDHDPFDEIVNGSHIIKTGCDAHQTSIIDIQWNDNNNMPDIQVQLVQTTSYAPDSEILARVKGHQRLLEELEQAKLFRIQPWKRQLLYNHKNNHNHHHHHHHHPRNVNNESNGNKNTKSHKKAHRRGSLLFSTRDNRVGMSVGTTVLTTMLRMGLHATCALMNAGSIRGNITYDPQEHPFFTWKDLKAEIPFPTIMHTLEMPGRVLEATIRHARQHNAGSGGYLHTCNNIVYNDDLECIETINGCPMEPDEVYLTAFPLLILKGVDNCVPLLEWAAANHIEWESLAESSVPAKLIIVQLCSALLWLQLGSFAEIDSDGDGVLSREDIQATVARHYGGDSPVTDLVVDNVMSIADIHHTGRISPYELIIVHLVASDFVSPYQNSSKRMSFSEDGTMIGRSNSSAHSGSSDDDDGDEEYDEDLLQAMRETAAYVLGKDTDDEDVTKMVQRIRETLYVDSQTGEIKRVQHEKTLGQLRRRSLLI